MMQLGAEPVFVGSVFLNQVILLKEPAIVQATTHFVIRLIGKSIRKSWRSDSRH